MKIVIHPVNAFNMLSVSDKTYFVNQTAYATQILPTTCPHRQGPLHFGKLSDDGVVIVCPWHENKIQVCNLEKKALPSVRTGDTLHVVTPEEATIRMWREYLPIESRERSHEA
jgi:nitrite reductase/ring-hydroxylating ferredoxin subunit